MGDICEIDHLEAQNLELLMRKEAILTKSIKVKSIEDSVAKIDKTVEKNEKRISDIRKEGQIFNNDSDDGVYNDDDNLEYRRLVALVKEKLPKDKKLPATVLDMLSEGFRQSEIAEYFEISKVRVSKIVTKIKEAIQYVSMEEYEEGSVYLARLWKQYTKDSNNTSNAQLDDEPINLNRQVYRSFGRDLQDDLREELYKD